MLDRVTIPLVFLVCLWGNSTDLSLLINMTEEQIKSLQSTGGEHLAATEKKYENKILSQQSKLNISFLTVYSAITFHSCGKLFPNRPFEAVVLISFLITLVSNFIVIVSLVRQFH